MRRRLGLAASVLAVACVNSNGLYVLEYTGRRAKEVRRIEFLEGNSNLGDALRLADTDDDAHHDDDEDEDF